MINEITFIGNLTKKPELRTVRKRNGDDTLVTTITIAVDRRRAGIPMDGTDFFDITVWGRSAENCATYLDKGSSVHVKCYVIVNSSEKDGQRRFFYQFTAQRVTFLNRNNNNSNKIDTTRSNRVQSTTEEEPTFERVFSPVDDNDIPF